MRNYWLVIFIVGIIPFTLNAQSDYYSSNSALFSGVKILDGGDLLNCKTCQVVGINKEIIYYSPDEISEYGFEDGRVYVSKDISINGSTEKVFLEKLISGKLSLFYYKGKGITTFFVEQDSLSFYEIPKSEGKEKKYYKTKLQSLMGDCSNVSKASKLVEFRKKSIAKLVEN